MEKKELIFEGNEKQLFQTEDSGLVIFHFKDVATAFSGVKRANLADKGKVNNEISSLLFGYLREKGINTHFVEKLGDREQLCRKISIIPLEFFVHNYIAGPLAGKLGIPEGTKTPCVVYDLRYNNDALGDPYINGSQARALGIVNEEDYKYMCATVKTVNELLVDLFDKAGLKLIDMKLEFGRSVEGEIILSDEISPDTCRIWDAETGEILDKDRFRHDLGYIVASYSKVYDKLTKVLE